MPYTITEFESVYKRCFPPSMRLAMSLLHEEDEARDVVHEVFLKLWESETRADNDMAFVIRSVRNMCINRIRKLEVRERLHKKLAFEPVEEDYDVDQRTGEVVLAVQRILSAREQQVVDKVYCQGLSYRDTAECLGVSVATVNKNLVGALRKLRLYFRTSKS